MTGKNNVYVRMNRHTDRAQRFTLKKLSVGVASVAVGATLLLAPAELVSAQVENEELGQDDDQLPEEQPTSKIIEEVSINELTENIDAHALVEDSEINSDIELSEEKFSSETDTETVESESPEEVIDYKFNEEESQNELLNPAESTKEKNEIIFNRPKSISISFYDYESLSSVKFEHGKFQSFNEAKESLFSQLPFNRYLLHWEYIDNEYNGTFTAVVSREKHELPESFNFESYKLGREKEEARRFLDERAKEYLTAEQVKMFSKQIEESKSFNELIELEKDMRYFNDKQKSVGSPIEQPVEESDNTVVPTPNNPSQSYIGNTEENQNFSPYELVVNVNGHKIYQNTLSINELDNRIDQNVQFIVKNKYLVDLNKYNFSGIEVNETTRTIYANYAESNEYKFQFINLDNSRQSDNQRLGTYYSYENAERAFLNAVSGHNVKYWLFNEHNKSFSAYTDADVSEHMDFGKNSEVIEEAPIHESEQPVEVPETMEYFFEVSDHEGNKETESPISIGWFVNYKDAEQEFMQRVNHDDFATWTYNEENHLFVASLKPKLSYYEMSFIDIDDLRVMRNEYGEFISSVKAKEQLLDRIPLNRYVLRTEYDANSKHFNVYISRREGIELPENYNLEIARLNRIKEDALQALSESKYLTEDQVTVFTEQINNSNHEGEVHNLISNIGNENSQQRDLQNSKNRAYDRLEQLLSENLTGEQTEKFTEQIENATTTMVVNEVMEDAVYFNNQQRPVEKDQLLKEAKDRLHNDIKYHHGQYLTVDQLINFSNQINYANSVEELDEIQRRLNDSQIRHNYHYDVYDYEGEQVTHQQYIGYYYDHDFETIKQEFLSRIKGLNIDTWSFDKENRLFRVSLTKSPREYRMHFVDIETLEIVRSEYDGFMTAEEAETDLISRLPLNRYVLRTDYDEINRRFTVYLSRHEGTEISEDFTLESALLNRRKIDALRTLNESEYLTKEQVETFTQQISSSEHEGEVQHLIFNIQNENAQKQHLQNSKFNAFEDIERLLSQYLTAEQAEKFAEQIENAETETAIREIVDDAQYFNNQQRPVGEETSLYEAKIQLHDEIRSRYESYLLRDQLIDFAEQINQAESIEKLDSIRNVLRELTYRHDYRFEVYDFEGRRVYQHDQSYRESLGGYYNNEFENVKQNFLGIINELNVDTWTFDNSTRTFKVMLEREPREYRMQFIDVDSLNVIRSESGEFMTSEEAKEELLSLKPLNKHVLRTDFIESNKEFNVYMSQNPELKLPEEYTLELARYERDKENIYLELTYFPYLTDEWKVYYKEQLNNVESMEEFYNIRSGIYDLFGQKIDSLEKMEHLLDSTLSVEEIEKIVEQIVNATSVGSIEKIMNDVKKISTEQADLIDVQFLMKKHEAYNKLQESKDDLTIEQAIEFAEQINQSTTTEELINISSTISDVIRETKRTNEHNYRIFNFDRIVVNDGYLGRYRKHEYDYAKEQFLEIIRDKNIDYWEFDEERKEFKAYLVEEPRRFETLFYDVDDHRVINRESNIYPTIEEARSNLLSKIPRNRFVLRTDFNKENRQFISYVSRDAETYLPESYQYNLHDYYGLEKIGEEKEIDLTDIKFESLSEIERYLGKYLTTDQVEKFVEQIERSASSNEIWEIVRDARYFNEKQIPSGEVVSLIDRKEYIHQYLKDESNLTIDQLIVYAERINQAQSIGELEVIREEFDHLNDNQARANTNESVNYYVEYIDIDDLEMIRATEVRVGVGERLKDSQIKERLPLNRHLISSQYKNSQAVIAFVSRHADTTVPDNFDLREARLNRQKEEALQLTTQLRYLTPSQVELFSRQIKETNSESVISGIISDMHYFNDYQRSDISNSVVVPEQTEITESIVEKTEVEQLEVPKSEPLKLTVYVNGQLVAETDYQFDSLEEIDQADILAGYINDERYYQLTNLDNAVVNHTRIVRYNFITVPRTLEQADNSELSEYKKAVIQQLQDANILIAPLYDTIRAATTKKDLDRLVEVVLPKVTEEVENPSEDNIGESLDKTEKPLGENTVSEEVEEPIIEENQDVSTEMTEDILKGKPEALEESEHAREDITEEKIEEELESKEDIPSENVGDTEISSEAEGPSVNIEEELAFEESLEGKEEPLESDIEKNPDIQLKPEVDHPVIEELEAEEILDKLDSIEANFVFTLPDDSAHHGSLGKFESLEQAEKRIRHFANQQGYTLQNFKIENGIFIATVTEKNI